MATRPKSRKAVGLDRARHDVPMRRWTILAQDPQLLGPGGRALTTTVSVPAERLETGPKGFRVHVVDYDASADAFYRSRPTDPEVDTYSRVTDIDKLVRDPYFHQQNVYAIAMSTLMEFECALGRPVGWGFSAPSHQLKISPHAFADANAFYSRQSESLNFGYFPKPRGGTVYTCLSHDIVTHETTHALLDGLRGFYLYPSSPDQAGFHEGFSDIVALLSVFRSTEIVERALQPLTGRDLRIPFEKLEYKSLANTALLRLAEEMGGAMVGDPTQSLRASLKLRPNKGAYSSDRFQEEHDLGELLVACVLRAFLKAWLRRLEPLKDQRLRSISRAVVAEEGARAARQLMRIAIRAIDYLPPVDLTYPDYLSALLTSDMQLYPDDDCYEYRRILMESFADYGILPASQKRGDGVWDPPPITDFNRIGTHFERMQRDSTEVFRFVWENRDALGIEKRAFTRVTSVRPVLRASNDQVMLRETVIEYVQTLNVLAYELRRYGLRKPDDMPGNTRVDLHGGGTLIFSEFGELKFHIGTGILSEPQIPRLQSLWDRGYYGEKEFTRSQIVRMHRDRALRPVRPPKQGVW